MNPRSALRLFIGLFWLFALLAAVPPRVDKGWPPPTLQAWVTAEASRTIPPLLIAALVVLAVASIASSVGLLLLRKWAAPVFLVSTILSYAAVALLGPHVAHGFTYACEGLAAICVGIVVALCFWSDALDPRPA